MSDISPFQFGQLMERVDNLVAALENTNEQSQANAACTRQLSQSMQTLSGRIEVLENSWLLQPVKVGRMALLTGAIIILFAFLGVKETITLLAKAAL